MEMNLEEHSLVAVFRSLDELGKKELQSYAAFLLKRERNSSIEVAAAAEGRCRLEKEEERPEAVAEPIFTE